MFRNWNLTGRLEDSQNTFHPAVDRQESHKAQEERPCHGYCCPACGQAGTEALGCSPWVTQLLGRAVNSSFLPPSEKPGDVSGLKSMQGSPVRASRPSGQRAQSWKSSCLYPKLVTLSTELQLEIHFPRWKTPAI